jgi:hypothetical protein
MFGIGGFGLGGSQMRLGGMTGGMGGSYLGGGNQDVGGMKLSGGGLDVMGTLTSNNQKMNDYWKNPMSTGWTNSGYGD